MHWSYIKFGIKIDKLQFPVTMLKQCSLSTPVTVSDKHNVTYMGQDLYILYPAFIIY